MSQKKNRSTYGKKSAKAQEELLNLDRNIKDKAIASLLQRKRKYLHDTDEDDDNNEGTNTNNITYANFQMFKQFPYTHTNTNNNNHNSNIKESTASTNNFNIKSNGKDKDTGNSNGNHLSNGINNNNNKPLLNIYPWISDQTRSYNGILRLHYEIYDFYNFMKPTTEETKAITVTFNYIKQIIEKISPLYKVKLFGSNATHLNLPDSDLDISILPKDSSLHYDSESSLIIIKDILFDDHKFEHLQIINARVPIIKGKFKETNLDVDISFGRKNGYEANRIIKNIIKDYPCIPPIICVLKYYLRQKKMNNTYTGGISSFCLFTLVYSYILYMKKNDLRTNETTLGDILIQFLTFYGFKFNYEDVGISIRYGGFFYKKDKQVISESYVRGNDGLLSIENFQDVNQDIGKNCFKYDKVIKMFQLARDSLYYPKKDEESDSIQSYLGQFIFIDDLILQRSKEKSHLTPTKVIPSLTPIPNSEVKDI